MTTTFACVVENYRSSLHDLQQIILRDETVSTCSLLLYLWLHLIPLNPDCYVAAERTFDAR